MDTTICKLCNENSANKTGSHIVPHFLLKRIDNEDGSTARDKELGFTLSEIYPSSYFGRSTSPEKLEEVYGEITDELIEEKSKLPFVEDYILCSDCEEKLSVIESEYSKTLDIQGEENTNYTSTNIPFLGFLFWASIIWRLSIATNSGFRLILRDENQLRNILNRYLNKDVKKVNPNPNDNLLKRIGYKAMRSLNYSENNSTILFCHPKYNRPYFFVIDEFALVFYFKKQDLNRNHNLFPFIPSEIINASYNTPMEIESILSVAEEVFKNLNTNFYEELGERFLQNFSKELDELHIKLGGKGRMPLKIKAEIASTMINDDAKMGVKYSLKHKAKTTFKVLDKYQKK